MGISGLLQFIKDASEPVSVRKYRGQTVAVDTYCWLHRGAFSCAEKLAKGEPTDQYVRYCIQFVDMLLTFGVKPVLVFDGRNLPSKKEVERSRRERREVNLQKGRQLLREGKLSEARDCFNRCVNITPAMAHNLIKAARAKGVDCVVAPYEADAQLAYLTKSGLAAAVITEDSDLLAFGCRKVILKMDKQGNGLEIDQSNLGRCRGLGNVFTEEKFRYMCILSGCDYLASMHGVGLGKACKLLRLAKETDILKVIRKMGQYLRTNMVVPEDYIEGFVRANNTFLYQLVFDPVGRKVVPLNPYPDHMDPSTLSYAGLNVGDEAGLQMALGNLDLNTMEVIDHFNPDRPPAAQRRCHSRAWSDSPVRPESSIWSKGSRPVSAASPCSPDPADKRPSTRGRERVISPGGVRLPCRTLQVKRPRAESVRSEQDVLQQYSSSSSSSSSSISGKRARISDQPRPRNCFSTLLQRRNQEEDEDHNSQTTCSRFFSGSISASSNTRTEPTPPQDSPPGVKSTTEEDLPTCDSDAPDPPSLETPSPPTTPDPVSPGPVSQGLRLFHRSAGSAPVDQSKTPEPTSGLLAFKRFQYKKESLLRSSDSQRLSRSSSTDGSSEERAADSTLTQDSAYFSQSQPEDPPSPKGEVSPYSFSSRSHREDPTAGSIQTSPSCSDQRSTSLGSKVSGLSRIKSVSNKRAVKVPSLGPARASGLRRTSGGSENSPGVQATISHLWKNFSFKKENLKRSTSEEGKPKPLSPVQDNILVGSTSDLIIINSC